MKIKEGGVMDIQKEEGDFNAWFNKQTINAVPDADLSLQRLWASLAWQAQAAKAQAVPEWISVEDKLPEIGVYVMVFLEKQGHNPTTYNFCQYTKFGFHLSNVTHWAPLPEPPETQEPAND